MGGTARDVAGSDAIEPPGEPEFVDRPAGDDTAGDDPSGNDPARDDPAGDDPRGERVVGSTEVRPIRARVLAKRVAAVEPATWCVWLGATTFAVVFGRLGVQHHRNFGTWAFDMGIYDQAFWLVSRGESFITVRGLDVWGHHVNLVAFLFAPFYWLGAGPSFLSVVQASVLGLGAVPAYLIARDRTGNAWVGTVIAYAYLLYAPVQWLTWANFHPEALVVTPLLFAWWLAGRRHWRRAYGAVLLALACREDVAMAVAIMGVVLWSTLRRRPDVDRHDRRMALLLTALGVLWYALSVRLVIPAFNRWQQPFYITGYYGNYGSDVFEIAQTMLQRPDRVVSDATQPDRLRFYRDLLLPWGGLPLGGLAQLAMALPQMLASAIGLTPYARSIRYQYTAVMIAPIVIAAIEGVALAWRHRWSRRVVLPWLVACAYVSNIAWSPSPLSANDRVWARPIERHEAMRAALTLVPDDASVTATYGLLPHLTHREQIYDWPNPFVEAYWGNDDGYRLPDPSTIDYLVLDVRSIGDEQFDLFDDLTGVGGEYELLFVDQDVIVAKRPDAPVIGQPD